MSRTLTLIHAGWTAARSLARSGRRTDALAHVKRLLRYSALPVGVAADAHRLAAELLIDAGRFAEARRHLRAAAGVQPEHAQTHYLTGIAFECDPLGDDRRAAVSFKKAVAAEPGNPLYRAAFGRAAVRCDRVKTGVRELLAAAEVGADNPAVVRVVVDGLLEAGRVRSARRVLLKARFLCPRNAEVRRLWERVRFEAARVSQESTQDARFATDGDTVFLPFVRVVGTDGANEVGTGWIRRDTVSPPRPHLARLRTVRADR